VFLDARLVDEARVSRVGFEHDTANSLMGVEEAAANLKTKDCVQAYGMCNF